MVTLSKITQSSDEAFNHTIYSTDFGVRSIAVDPRRGVVFLASVNIISSIHNYSFSDSNNYFTSIEFNGKSNDVGEIAFDYLSNNLFWCDSLLNWIAMKPAYTTVPHMYKVVVQDNIRRPEGLILDPLDG